MEASQSQDLQPSIENHGSTIKPQNQEGHVHLMEQIADPLELSDTKANAKEKPQRISQLPHRYEAILRDADSPVYRSSMDNLLSQLYAGVFLNQKRKKYWVDKRSNKNCFMLFARDLSITWAEDERYWYWLSQKETTSNVSIEVARLRGVCWFEVNGKFDIAKLSPETFYRVKLVVMLDKAYGWTNPVNFSLTLPNGQKVEREENLTTKPRQQWIEIPVGEFETSSNDVGELHIKAHKSKGGNWMGGLILKGVVIKAQNQPQRIDQLPHRYEAILRDASSPVDRSSMEESWELRQ